MDCRAVVIVLLLATSALVVSEKDDTSLCVYEMIANLLKDGYEKLKLQTTVLHLHWFIHLADTFISNYT